MAVTQTVKTLDKKLEYKISIRPSQEKKLKFKNTKKKYFFGPMRKLPRSLLTNQMTGSSNLRLSVGTSWLV